MFKTISTMDNAGNNLMKMKSDSIVVMTITYGIIVLFCIFSVLRLGLISTFNLNSSIPTSPSPTNNADHNRQKPKPVIRWVPQATYARVPSHISCDRSHYHYDFCLINGSTVLDPTTFTLYSVGPTRPKYFIQSIRPYPRKWENSTMSNVKEVTLISGSGRPICDVEHNTSAVVFTAGGYTGNLFHDFNEGFLSLFVTVGSMSLADHEVTLVIGKSRDWWVRKYGDILRAFSVHPIVNIDEETKVHCFRSATVGLITHGYMTINPHLLPNKTLLHFHGFLNKAYSQGHQLTTTRHLANRPKMVILSRTGNVGRVITNQAELKVLAEEVGFYVVIFEPKPNTSLREVYGLMNDTHAMLGVHGAAVTHLLFLRPGSVFIQVVPIGTDEIAELCYGRPAKEMGLDYMEYKIDVDESSLVNKYNKHDPILADPTSRQGLGWALYKKVYLKEQNVKLNLFRLRKYLKKAYRKAKKFMKSVG